jgi:hypothetical protein
MTEGENNITLTWIGLVKQLARAIQGQQRSSKVEKVQIEIKIN